MAQKVIDGDDVTCQHMHLILRWISRFAEREGNCVIYRYPGVTLGPA